VDIRSFRPIIYSSHVDEAVAPPFDTISRHQKESLLRTPYNITHVTTLSRGNFRDAPKIMRRWMNEGILKKLDRECMIILEQEFHSMGEKLVRIGLISLVSIEDGWEQIKPHENTFRWAVDERKELMKESGCQLEPIFLAVASNSFENLLRRMIQESHPDLEFEEPLGVITRPFSYTTQIRLKKFNQLSEMMMPLLPMVITGFRLLRSYCRKKGLEERKSGPLYLPTPPLYTTGD